MTKPRIINGICEFCGVPANECFHYSNKHDSNQSQNLKFSKEYLKDNQKIADIIIPHHNNHKDLCNLLEDIDVSIFNIIICAGDSFGINCNKGAKLAETDKLIFLNDDIELKIGQLIKIAENIGKYDFVSSTQLAGIDNIKKYYGIGLFEYSDGKIYHSISTKEKNSLFPSGFLFGITKKAWNKLGGFNEDFKTGNEDVDLGLRAIDLGLSMNILDLEIRHKESQSIGRFDYIKENEDLIYSLYPQDKLRKYYENSNRL